MSLPYEPRRLPDRPYRLRLTAVVSALHEADTDGDGTFDTRTLTEYLIDPYDASGYQQVLQETVKNADTGEVLRTVIYTLGLDHIAQTTFTPGGPTDGETLFFHFDGHGSTRVLTNAAATIATLTGALVGKVLVSGLIGAIAPLDVGPSLARVNGSGE